MSITKFNHNTAKFIAKAEKDTPYYSLKDLYKAKGKDADYLILALYINEKGKYGKQPLALARIDGKQIYINLPSHLLKDVDAMLADPDVIDQINKCNAGMKIRAYVNRNGGESYSVEWLDLDTLPF